MIDLYEQMRQITITAEMKYGISFKNKVRVLLGMKLIELGCFLAGINYEDESK